MPEEVASAATPSGVLLAANSFTDGNPPPQPHREEIDFKERPQLSWPIYYHRRHNKDNETYVFGPLWIYEKKRDGFANYPLWPFTGIEEAGDRTTIDLLWPLTGLKNRGGDVEQLDLVWPFTGYNKHDGYGGGSRYSLIRPFTELKTRNGELTTLDLLWPITGYEAEQKESRFRILWPFTEIRTSSDSTNLDLLWPLTGYQSRTRNEQRYDQLSKKYVENPVYENYGYLVRPLFGWYEKGLAGQAPQEEHLCLMPAYCGIQTGPTRFSFLAPTLFWGRDETEGSRWSTFFPLYFESASPGESSLYIIPSFYQRNGPSGKTSMLLPLYYRDKDAASTSLYIFPSYWQSRTADEAGTSKETTSLLPIFHTSSDTAGNSSNYAFPSIIWGGSKVGGYSGLLPVYYRSEEPTDKLLYVFPTFYARSNDDYETTKVIPFFTSTKEKKEGEQYHSVLWPLYYHRENSAKDTFYTSLVWPLYIAKKEDDRTETHSLFWPLYFKRENERSRSAYRSVFWPFYIESREGETEETAFFGRLYYNFNSPERQQEDILPFYSRDEDRDWKVTTYWPLLARKNTDKLSGASAWNSLIPLSIFTKLPPLFYMNYDEATRESYTTVLWPITAFEESPAREKVRVWPYSYEYDRVANFRSHHFIWPLVSYGSGPEETTSRALPLFSHTRGRDFGSTFVLPIYWHSYDPEVSRTVVFPLYWEFTDPMGSRTTVPPFSWTSTPSSGGSSFTLFPLIHLEREKEHSRTLVAPLFYSDKTPTTSSLIFLPLYLNFKDENSSRTIIPPLSWGESAESSSFMFLPLYYSSTTHNSKLHILLNTYWEEDANSSSSGFAPLYFHWKNGSHAATLLGPLYWSDAGNGDGSFVFFPFVWKFSDQASSSFTLFPLMHYETGKAKETREFSILWRLYHHATSPESTSTTGLYGLYRNEERPGYSLNRFRPFFEYEQETTAGREETYFSLFFELFRRRRVNDKVEVRILFIPVYSN